MIEWLKTWVNQIIVAIIIAVIFELIIPNGKNKKYIKMMINLYVLFVLINPIITKFTNLNTMDLSQYDYDKYFNQTTVVDTSSSAKSEEIIKDTLKKSIQEDIKRKLSEQGYNIKSISINIDNNNYENINWIKISVIKKNNTDFNESNNILDVVPFGDSHSSSVQINSIRKVDINTNNIGESKKLRKNEKEKIKKILSKEYEISEEKIYIN